MDHNAQRDDIVMHECTAKSDVHAVLSLARRLTGSERTSLMLPSLAASELHVVAATGIASDRVIDARVRLGVPVAGMVAETGRSLLINDAQEFTDIVGRQPLGNRSAAFISVPVPFAASGRGVLNIADPVGRQRFRSDDLNAIQGLATIIGRLDSLRAELDIERQRALAIQKELLWVQESERHRLARDLHDEAGHALTLAVFQIDLERIKPTINLDTTATLTKARDALLNCATALNDMAFQLRPRILEDLGLVSALRALVAQMHDASKTHISLDLNGAIRSLSNEGELVAFRVVQEGLTNIRKHAEASHAWITLDFHDKLLEIRLCDNGLGTTTEQAMSNQHSSQGLRGMRERVEFSGGELEFFRTAQQLTCLSVRLPLA